MFNQYATKFHRPLLNSGLVKNKSAVISECMRAYRRGIIGTVSVTPSLNPTVSFPGFNLPIQSAPYNVHYKYYIQMVPFGSLPLIESHKTTYENINQRSAGYLRCFPDFTMNRTIAESLNEISKYIKF